MGARGDPLTQYQSQNPAAGLLLSVLQAAIADPARVDALAREILRCAQDDGEVAPVGVIQRVCEGIDRSESYLARYFTGEEAGGRSRR